MDQLKNPKVILIAMAMACVTVFFLDGITLKQKQNELDKSMQMMEESLQLQREQVEILKNFEVDIK